MTALAEGAPDSRSNRLGSPEQRPEKLPWIPSVDGALRSASTSGRVPDHRTKIAVSPTVGYCGAEFQVDTSIPAGLGRVPLKDGPR